MSPDATPTEPRSFLAGRRKWAILGVLVILLGGLAALYFRNAPEPATNGTTTSTESIGDAPTLGNSPRAFRQVTVPLVADADKDGLADQRETELKTNPRLADSDGDQLNDYDEVEIYRSDPLKQDSDGDGFPDGEEVRSGNNPTGTGTLLNLQQTISNINAQ